MHYLPRLQARREFGNSCTDNSFQSDDFFYGWKRKWCHLSRMLAHNPPILLKFELIKMPIVQKANEYLSTISQARLSTIILP